MMNALRRAATPAIAWILAVAATGCVAGKDDRDTPARLSAAVSIAPQQWMLEQIAGERVKGVCMLPAGADPESYEPGTADVVALSDAQVYFTLGGIPMEEALLQRVRAALPRLQVENSIRGIPLLHDDCHSGNGRHDHDEAGDFDPHVWTSPANCRIMARNMTDYLKATDPEMATEYEHGFARLDSLLAVSSDSIRHILAPCSDRTIMAWHPSLGYFARDFGLRQLSVQQEGKEVTPRQLVRAIDESRSLGAVAVFYDRAAQGRESALLSSDLGIPAVGLRLTDRDFLNELIKAATAVRDNQLR